MQYDYRIIAILEGRVAYIESNIYSMLCKNRAIRQYEFVFFLANITFIARKSIIMKLLLIYINTSSIM